jgi:hypothetical protein
MKGYFYQDKVGCFKYRTLCIAWRLMLLGGGIRLSSKKRGYGHDMGCKFQPSGVHFDRPFDLMKGNVGITEQKEGRISMEDRSLNL